MSGDLVAARHFNHRKYRSLDIQTERLLRSIILNGPCCPAQRAVDARAARRHLSGMLESKLRPYPKAALQQAENDKHKRQSRQGEFNADSPIRVTKDRRHFHFIRTVDRADSAKLFGKMFEKIRAGR